MGQHRSRLSNIHQRYIFLILAIISLNAILADNSIPKVDQNESFHCQKVYSTSRLQLGALGLGWWEKFS